MPFLFIRYIELQRVYKLRIDDMEKQFMAEKRRLLTLREQRRFVMERLARQVSDLRLQLRMLQIDVRRHLVHHGKCHDDASTLLPTFDLLRDLQEAGVGDGLVGNGASKGAGEGGKVRARSQQAARVSTRIKLRKKGGRQQEAAAAPAQGEILV